MAMTVFVSYARRDHDRPKLREIAKRVSHLGEPYIDDLVDHDPRDRRVEVFQALTTAVSLMLVDSPSYFTTPWTCMEGLFAFSTGAPAMLLSPNGALEIVWSCLPMQHLVGRAAFTLTADVRLDHQAG